MARYIVRRFFWMLLVLFVISVITFVLMRSVPGGPFTREKALPAQTIAILEQKYNLDAPLLEQYASYIGDIFVPRITMDKMKPSTATDYLLVVPIPSLGKDAAFRWVNFGPTYKSRSRSVNDIFRENLPISFEVGVSSIVVALVIGVPLGIIAALNRNTRYDYLSMAIAIAGVSVPVIVVAPLLQYFIGIPFQMATWTDNDHIKSLILPSIALGFGSAALLARLTRASLLQVLNEDYIRTARAKGLSERRVVILHALKNSLIPVITVLGPLFAALVTGTFVVETVFAVPGMGKYFVTSISGRDYPVIMGTVLLYAMFLVTSNLLVDITYAFLDPRIRFD
jgi:ABC-type dipeptide/oligopeptide/nickel transport system permease component